MSLFENAIPTILEHEGGLVDDPDDAGGITNFGISKRAHPDVDVANLTEDGAAEIYRTEYWNANGYDRIDDQAVAVKVFDFAVNMGARRSHRLLQQAINLLGGELVVDGLLGPISFAAANGANPERLVRAIEGEAARRYHSIANGTQEKYLKGWLNRCYGA